MDPVDAEPIGAGSGGEEGDGHYTKIVDGAFVVGGATALINAAGSVGEGATSPVVSILAGAGTAGAPDGRVEVHGSQGVRITAGPPNQPQASDDSINGATVFVGETQIITLQRGMSNVQEIQMQPTFIVVDGGTGSVQIMSTTKITLTVAGGTSSITLTPEGITIKGLLTQIN